VFGVEPAALGPIKGAFEAVCALAVHRMAETDDELGVNLVVFSVRNWAELAGVPGLDWLVEGRAPRLDRLQAAGANRYRLFRFEPDGAIRTATVMLRMDEHLAAVPADILALTQAIQTTLLGSDTAFTDSSPMAEAGGHVILRPEIGALIRAACDPVLPTMATDPTQALRLAARPGGAH
jgi:hypothetical protein